MNRQQQIDQFLARAHLLALQRLREQPAKVNEVQAQLTRWRAQAGATRSDGYWREWEALLCGPIDVLAETVCGDGEHAAALRSVSPISVLITQAERIRLLREARQSA